MTTEETRATRERYACAKRETHSWAPNSAWYPPTAPRALTRRPIGMRSNTTFDQRAERNK